MNKILIVENEPIARNHLKRALETSGVVLEASSPAETLDIFRNHRDIDLLVCDVELGLVSGMELASLLRAWKWPTARGPHLRSSVRSMDRAPGVGTE